MADAVIAARKGQKPPTGASGLIGVLFPIDMERLSTSGITAMRLR
jgi:hypothetical protein